MKGLIKRALFGSAPKPFKVLTGIGRGTVFYLDPSCESQRILGIAEREVMSRFKALLAGVQLFCDIGCSDGMYSILAAKLNSRCGIVACDPGAGFQEKFFRNWNLNTLDAERVRFLPSFVGSELSLDDLVGGKRAFVKIDVEGYEANVLRTGSLLLHRGCSLLIETHSMEVELETLRILEEHKFACKVIRQAWWRFLIPEQRPTAHNRWISAHKP
ncbi:MAG: hypothetical protein KIS92_07065 [Planctomycetota bacterium]|nr:hypothetical protein [Planctomycetota bacterium]